MANLREVLEDAALALREANFGMENTASTAMWVQQRKLEVRKQGQAEAWDPGTPWWGRSRIFRTHQESRLALRVRRDDDCFEGYAAAGESFMRALQALLEYSDGRVDGPKVSGTLRECQDAIQEAETLFFEGARPIIGVDLA